MSKTITFNELRRIKDSLPEGGIRKIARELDLSEEEVRNYFGKGETAGIHYEKGPNGGTVVIEDTTILDLARKMIE
ncbi:MAG TPA: DNA-binding protein [Bacteroidales bacterium]|nr:DNA-binding protein [Bacteroidales bacterium]HQG35763.1 DNA-binding protein [Bacteroidales bacterium]HQG52321.1 DNA-binding protein [Bacteroidales bacterium]HQJ19817.1 DNA-binding protein [Bacteroidales bacterium]